MNNEAALLSQVPAGLYINGSWQDSSTGKRFSVVNPATGSELTTVADASPADGAQAMAAAAEAQLSWAATAPRTRSELLRAAFHAVLDRGEEFATLMTLEMGKPIAEARGEVTYGAEFLRWFAEEAVRIAGDYQTSPEGHLRFLTLRKPVGPSLLITPWNFPLAMATRKIAPALAAGCTVVLKPAELTPLTSLLFTEVLDEVGVPAGVVNVVPTTDPAGVTDAIMADQRLRKISFTGSTPVGKHLLRQAADNVLATSMELGGNAPFLVFADADIDAAVAGAMQAKLRNIGEACNAANRFHVQTPVADEFATKLAEQFRKLRAGAGMEPESMLGPVIDERSRIKINGLVSDAVQRGATVLTGGSSIEGPGYFFEPTVLTGVSPESQIATTEIFGPVAAISTFETEDEAVNLANNSPFGLMAFAYTSDLDRSLRLPERLEVGMLAINTGVISNPAAPFGGVKQSGLGREGGHEGIDGYLETTYVGIPNPT